jgi:hypothetical protein
MPQPALDPAVTPTTLANWSSGGFCCRPWRIQTRPFVTGGEYLFGSCGIPWCAGA